MAKAKAMAIPLQTPIKRSDTKITEVVLRKPNAGELRGLSLSRLMTMEVDDMLKVIPRISTPALLPSEVKEMDPADFTLLADEVVSFLVPASQLAALREQMNR